MHPENLVSVVIPAYNRAAYLPRALESILIQDCLGELIVVDDGSTDATPDVVKPYLGRIRYIRTTNRERGAARNRGANEATFPYITFCDSDDRMFPDHLRNAVRTFERGDDLGAVYSDIICEGPDGAPTNHVRGARVPGYKGGAPVTSLLANFDNCGLGQGATIYRRSAFLAAGGFREERELSGAEDFEFHTRFIATYRVAPTLAPTFGYLTYDGNTFANPASTKRCMETAVEFVTSNPSLSQYSSLFPRMRGHASLSIASSFLGAKSYGSVARYLLRAVRVHPAIALESRYLRVAAKLAIANRGALALQLLARPIRRKSAPS